MSADNYEGPRCGSDVRDGMYQYPALAAGAIIDLSDWAGEYIEISWIPAAGELLLYGFFTTAALATTGFDATTVSGTPGVIVPTAPKRLEGAAPSPQVTVPRTHLHLRIEPASGSGLCTVNHAEAAKQPPGSGGVANPPAS